MNEQEINKINLTLYKMNNDLSNKIELINYDINHLERLIDNNIKTVIQKQNNINNKFEKMYFNNLNKTYNLEERIQSLESELNNTKKRISKINRHNKELEEYNGVINDRVDVMHKIIDNNRKDLKEIFDDYDKTIESNIKEIYLLKNELNSLNKLIK